MILLRIIFLGDIILKGTFEYEHDVSPIKKFNERGRIIGNN